MVGGAAGSEAGGGQGGRFPMHLAGPILAAVTTCSSSSSASSSSGGGRQNKRQKMINFKAGDRVDAMDLEGVWHEGLVKDINPAQVCM